MSGTYYLEGQAKHIGHFENIRKVIGGIGLIGSLSLFAPLAVFAEHEANHRYLVSGYVRDNTGKAIGNSVVNLEHKGGEKKEVKTDRNGYYESRFHLHNENFGDTIVVIASGVTKKVKVEFDEEDDTSFRGTTVDFGATSTDNSPAWTFLTIFSLVVLSGAVYFGIIKKKSRMKSPEKVKKTKKKRKK